ncbi:MAG: hypothetical protein ABIQ16_05550 [Polyangiaceae bacterium]
MSVLSISCCSLFSAICAFTLVSSAGCGTDAKGVDDCRDIEEARCVAAKSCDLLGDVDVDGCKRFYRDQCLHGLAVSSPGPNQVKLCVAAIQNAGSCVRQSGGKNAPLDECDPRIGISSSSSATTACEIVNEPELATECAFLVPSEGSGGRGGESAGSSGSAGSND